MSKPQPFPDVTRPLTPQQNKVLYHLQNGYCLITGCDVKGAWVAAMNGKEFYIGSRLFWNLHDLGLIRQQLESPFDYVLTPKGQSVKTKPCTL